MGRSAPRNPAGALRRRTGQLRRPGQLKPVSTPRGCHSVGGIRTTKCARRLRLQQDSLDSVHCGASLP